MIDALYFAVQCFMFLTAFAFGYVLSATFNFPVLGKPWSGFRFRGIEKISTANQLAELTSDLQVRTDLENDFIS